ncbi:MAG: hypothetical protein A2508_10010 [Candidatus Lambdaproteobacteria bacterium RIFOXYD12_FULL_49_8]|uniref:Amino-acid acetyltransferase n=1 Tax=Candidatus Lambdaproteobacteria bacterium RIFOXYD2_FULL_50_16 TaxID=1817772 RepID=A0A1F6GA07_9PROT|nr:MAG: hypothetical protein A2527_06320 [Candidatus Lambdaproteobacteria bacterium RIFOXYD2_FULL_50_16]OGG97834.1 MAG: hypothetical protein A2508_10010 [Candidatus Lambdaproteobacteria bacterium RIFOXYD12_FULL_49_8]
MRPSISKEMLEALEHFAYASSFAQRRFLCVFESPQDLVEMITDLRLLQQARLDVLLLSPEAQGLPHGFPIDLVKNQARLKAALKAHRLPLLAPPKKGDLAQAAWDLALKYQAERICWLGRAPGIIKNGELISHLDLAELAQLVLQQSVSGVPLATLERVLAWSKQSELEWVFVGAQSGNLFLEIFTHQGAGTLIGPSYQKEIGPANAADLLDLLLLMRPHFEDGTLLPIDEAQLSQDLEQYRVFRLDGALVVTARLKRYGDQYELGKFCSLPRYQGRGRAMELVKAMAEEARAAGGKRLFALTIEPKIGKFFERLGFVPVERESLPEQWAQGYDFSRPSKAYALEF